MKFLKFSAYYLYNYFLNKGNPSDNAKLRSTGYITISLFFYFLSILMPIRFLDIDFSKYPSWVIKGSVISFGIILYSLIYFNIEKEEKFYCIIKEYQNQSKRTYSHLSVWLFIFGSLFLFISMFLMWFIF